MPDERGVWPKCLIWLGVLWLVPNYWHLRRCAKRCTPFDDVPALVSSSLWITKGRRGQSETESGEETIVMGNPTLLSSSLCSLFFHCSLPFPIQKWKKEVQMWKQITGERWSFSQLLPVVTNWADLGKAWQLIESGFMLNLWSDPTTMIIMLNLKLLSKPLLFCGSFFIPKELLLSQSSLVDSFPMSDSIAFMYWDSALCSQSHRCGSYRNSLRYRSSLIFSTFTVAKQETNS